MTVRQLGAVFLQLLFAGLARSDEANAIAELKKLGGFIKRDNAKPAAPR